MIIYFIYADTPRFENVREEGSSKCGTQYQGAPWRFYHVEEIVLSTTAN